MNNLGRSPQDNAKKTNIKGLGKKIFKFLLVGVNVKREFGLSIKEVKVNPRSSFFQTLSGPCQICIPSPRASGPLVPEKKIFKGFLLYKGLGQVTQMLGTNFHSLGPWRLHMNDFDWPSSSEKKKFEECRQLSDRLRTEPIYTIKFTYET